MPEYMFQGSPELAFFTSAITFKALNSTLTNVKILVIANCNFPNYSTVEDFVQVLSHVKQVDKIVLLGDFIDLPRRFIADFIRNNKKLFHKLVNKLVSAGCSKIVYVVGDRDQAIANIQHEVMSDIFSSRLHLVKISTYHVENIHNVMCVFSHGHTQINIAITEELASGKSDEEILFNAARRARRKEEIAGLRSVLKSESWWFIGHTNLLKIDREYKIVHCGYFSSQFKISGCGPITKGMYISEQNRGFVLIDSVSGEVQLVQYPSMKIVDKVRLPSGK